MRRLPLILIASAAAYASVPTPTADACGGTFCDSGPFVSPVDQAAETVLFIQDGDFVEAHIQITIDPNTEAQKFAWIVPMLAAPEFSIGSQPLFDTLLGSTTPNYYTNGESCGNDDPTVGFIQDPDGGSASGEPDAQTQTVGAFEVTTLQGGTVDGVMQWLGDNGYQQDPAAEPILGEYIANGHVLVAFRLTPNAGIADIHPVVLRYEGDEPCVPIKLTAIAAAPDMGIRAFFLGESRYAPTNYSHVVVNPLRLDWNRNESAYVDAITMAVDEAPAGHGFVTEYAGATDIVSDDGLYSNVWNAAPFAGAAAIDVVDMLNAQGLAQCTPDICLVPHQLVVALLLDFLPPPEDVNPNDFYGCLSCYADMTDFAEWDGPAFAAQLDERVIDPARHSRDLLAAWPYLTRMYTTISAHEMTVDPTFHPNAELADVPRSAVADEQCVCDEDSVITLPDGRMVYNESAMWPNFGGMPYAERLEQIPPVGAPMIELDNRALIDEMLAEYNAQHECMPSGSGSGSGSEGGVDTSDPTASGTNPSDTSGGSGDSSASGDQDLLDSKGCGCATDGDGEPGSWLAAAFAALYWIRRRRRAARPSTTAKSPAAPGPRSSVLQPQPNRSRSSC